MGTIGETLMYLRESHELSKSKLAEVAKISGSSYADIERGFREASFIVIFRICSFYQISLQEFAENIDPIELERRELSSLRNIEKRVAKGI
ncbi:helix-turn-helix domain-containing protein [Belliella sp. DSM 111904]|uniref:Helix-turn-helix domain-containing protein n=1 Tax=Belliella filtrata TaxID=2923435 RepID=A0ABS9UVV4_9BACT|nr:helix-turn-helix transcriptional regulator [Belliella filtrata]MCH7408178.1 helix-turn-helix domain-containing protein [Belliella filtrata]